jgi:hypothetical protein
MCGGCPEPTPWQTPTPTPQPPISPFQVQMCPADPDCDPNNEDCPQRLSTAFGCIETTPFRFIKQFRDILIGIGSGIALLMMIVGAFFVLISQGQPEKVERGKEIFVGGAVGLLIMILSLFLLRLIGVDILGLLRG